MHDEHSEHGCKHKGQKLRVKLAMMRCMMAGLFAVGVIFYLSSLHSRMSPWTYWSLFGALAVLAASAMMGAGVVEKSINSLIENNDWPVEAEVGGYAKWQKLLIGLAWLLILVGVITAVYVKPGIRRPQPNQNQMMMQQNQRMPDGRMQQQMLERQGMQPGQPIRPQQPGMQPGGQPGGQPGQQPQRPGANQPPGGQVPPGQNPPGGQRPPGGGGQILLPASNRQRLAANSSHLN